MPVVPAAAPAAPAPAPAAASAPVTSPTPPAAAPAAISAPAAAALAVTGTGAPTPPAKLNPAQYENAVDSYQAEVTWKQQLEAFRSEHPEIGITDESPWPGAGTEPADGETKPAEVKTDEAKPDEKPLETETKAEGGDADELYSLDDSPSLTPQALNDIIKGDEALKAAIEANPAAKGALFKMAREHAELSQFKGIFPNKDAAEFARKESASKVALKTQFQMADTPEGMAKAFDSFMQEFAVIGADGKQVVDDAGSPVYGDDLYAFGEHVVDRYTDSTLAEVEERLKANQYATDADRERDSDLKLALDIIKGDLHPADPAKKADPDLSKLDPDARAEVQARLDEAKRIESQNAEATAGKGKKTRDQVRSEGNTQFFTDAGTRMFQQVDGIVDKLRKAGAVIPEWQLSTPLPGQKTSAFRNAVGNEIENHLRADPYESNNQFQLELAYIANPTPENLKNRTQAFDRFLQTRDHTGKSLLNRVVTKLVRQYGSQVQTATETATSDTAPAASIEPKAGPAVKPHQMTGDEAWRAAEKQLVSERKDWHNMSDTERLSETFGRQRQILTAKR